ncbi:acetylcholine receptor subunit beta-like [Pecten maximus]|uniref:acetylcholine receptor subunit beta-like n=1 Tax=Pecten maximus TaxID=6579 RepID=UPI0014586367|nr:acetylcholine receptor subunit beta-like [Pecten maximus]
MNCFQASPIRIGQRAPQLTPKTASRNYHREIEMNPLWVVVLCYTVQATIPGVPPDYSTELESQLRTGLFSEYEVLQRPSHTVHVKVSITLLTVNELNIKDQALSITAYFTLSWMDARLSWASNTTYGNIRFLFSTETYVWRPALIIDNAVDELTVMSDKNIPIRIASSGTLHWNPAGVYTVACDSDITFYPLDIQTCTLSVSSWAYTSNEIDLEYDTDHSNGIDITSYSQNGEWDLVSTFVEAEGNSKTRGSQTFSNVKFSIVLRRKPLFHLLNTIFPVALMAFLSAMVFKLPPDSGEKIGFSLTVLLAYAVYLTLISDNIPSTSVSVCYLSIYLALILVFGSISVVCTILVLNFHHRSNEKEPIPMWLKMFIFNIVAKVVCWKGHCCCRKRSVSPSSIIPDVQSTPIKHNDPESNEKVVPVAEVSADNDDDFDEVEDVTWQDIAGILDKFFFFLFMVSIGLSTIVIFSLLMNNFLKAAF